MASTACARYMARDLSALLDRIHANDGTWVASDLADRRPDGTVALDPNNLERTIPHNAVVKSDDLIVRNMACQRYVQTLLQLADHCDRLEPRDISSVVARRVESYGMHMAAFGFYKASMDSPDGIVDLKVTVPSGDWCAMVQQKASSDRAAYRTLTADTRHPFVQWLFPTSPTIDHLTD